MASTKESQIIMRWELVLMAVGGALLVGNLVFSGPSFLDGIAVLLIFVPTATFVLRSVSGSLSPDGDED